MNRLNFPAPDLELVMPTPEEVQEIKDTEHLRLLSIFHYANAGFFLIGLLFLLFHGAIMGLVLTMAAKQSPGRGGPPPQLFGFFVMGFYVVIGNIIAVQTIFNILSARYLRSRKRRILSMIVAAINCLQFPMGTMLGVSTLVVLTRASVRKMYEQQALSDASSELQPVQDSGAAAAGYDSLSQSQ